MSTGMAVYDDSGSVVWDTAGTLARIIGTASISPPINQTGTFTVSIPGLISTDTILVNVIGNPYVEFAVSTSGTDVSITRSIAGGLGTITFLIVAIR
jgi:hypothetical protein